MRARRPAIGPFLLAVACWAGASTQAWPEGLADQGRPDIIGELLDAALLTRADAPAWDLGMAGGYVDRLIDGGAMKPLATAGGDSAYDDRGPLRYLQLQAVASGSSGGGLPAEEGVAVDAGLQTTNWGTISLQGVFRARPLGGSLAVLQRGMPVDGSWTANNGLGALNSPAIDLARNQYRFYLPTFPMAGLTSEWLQRGGLQLLASAGEPGLFDGLQLDGFNRLGGILATAGAQGAIDSHWAGGVQAVTATGVTTPALTEGIVGLGPSPAVSAAVPDTNAVSAYGSVAWRDGVDFDQLNLVHSDTSMGRSAFGAWLDGSLARGRLTQNYGAFWLQPGLAWGYLPISSDSEGAYYRAAWRSQQWLLDGGFDLGRSLSGAGLAGALITGSARYQFDPATALGGAISFRASTPDAGEGDLFVESQSRFGAWRIQLDQGYDNDDDLTRLSLEQTWKTPVGTRLSTSVFVTREVVAARASAGGGGAFSGGGPLLGRFSWDGSLSFNATAGAGASRDLNANLSLNARLNDRWSLSATWFDNRDQSLDPLLIGPIVPAPLTPVVSRSSAFLLSLRFSTSAGSVTAVAGGRPGDGAGAIAGRLFLDDEGDGVFRAGDKGAAGVTVLLDGLYAARTDARGAFAFPVVSPGPHEVRIVADNLPLPWAVADDGRRSIVVRPRQTVSVDIAATRIR